MSDLSKNLGQQLTALEPVNSAAREPYERQLQNILEERLSVPVRGLLRGGGPGLPPVRCWGRLRSVLRPGSLHLLAQPAARSRCNGNCGGNRGRADSRRCSRHLPPPARRAMGSVDVLALLATWGLFMLLAAFGLPDDLRQVFLALGLVCLGAAGFVAQRLSAARAQLSPGKRLLELELPPGRNLGAAGPLMVETASGAARAASPNQRHKYVFSLRADSRQHTFPMEVPMTKWHVPLILVVGLLLAADSPEDTVKKEKEKLVRYLECRVGGG